MKFRTKLAAVLTFIYLCGFLVVAVVRRDEFLCLSLNELGDFLAGAFGPLAFAWLVFGYFQQGDELKQGTEALKLQAKELNESVRQQTYLVEAQRVMLDNEERALEPILYVVYDGPETDQEGDYDSFEISNSGGYCDRVEVYVNNADDPRDKVELDPLHHNSKRGFLLEPIYSASITLIVKYRLVGGKLGEQRFEVKGSFYEDEPVVRVKKLT